MIKQTTLHNILTWIVAVILFIFQSLNYFISWIKKFVKHGQKNTTVVTTDTIILSESNRNNNNAPENVITVQGLIQKHFDIPLIIAEDEPKVNDFIKNAQLTSYDNYKEKKKIDQFMEHLVDDSYVARGLGLITANVGREAEFYLYSKYDNNFENVVIKLKGRQGEIGQITIPNQNPTNSIETKSIPMDYFYDEDRIKVTYTPFAEGVYTLTLVRNGLSICRSPYYISVEKSPTNSRSQIRLGTKRYKMVTKFAKAKNAPLETCDNSILVIEPSKPSINRNILPTLEENSIRTDVMSIVTKFESNSIHFQKNDKKSTVNKSKKSTKTDLFDEISISADSNTQPKLETGNDYNTNINDLSSLSIDSNSKSKDKKFSSNSNVNSIEIESNLVKKSNKKLDESIRNINDIPRVKNISSNHLEPTNSVLLKESLDVKSSDDVEKHIQTYKTNKPIHGQNQIETFLDPITVDKSDIECIDNKACTHNEVSCFDDDDRKTVIVMKNINELKTHPNISMNRQFTDSAQYNINTPFTGVLTKITNDVCEKCSIKVLRILSEFPRDINITHNNNSNENCSSFETLLAQPISININIDNLYEKPISPINEHKTDNLLTNSATNMKLMDTIDKDIKYHYINEIKPINTTFNEIYCDINNTTTELIVKQNKHDGEINKTINDKITNKFKIPLTKNNIDKHKTDHLENKLSTDNKMQIQVQNVQKSSEHNMDIDKTNQIEYEYINNELNDINKENGTILDTCDLVSINNDKKSNEELVTKELKTKNVIMSDEYKHIQSSIINSQTVLASMEDKLPTSRYKTEDIRQEISNISNTNDILPENQKLIIENAIEPVLKNFKNKIVENITQLYLNKDLTSSDNTLILENHNINLTHNLQKNQLHNNADNKNNKTKLIETIRSQLKNHFHKNDIPGMILNNKKTDNNQLYKYLENIIKTNMNSNEMHSQRLDKNDFQTLVSIAKNQQNKQQIDNDFKMITLENITPNYETKNTNDDEKVPDTEIKFKNIPDDTSIKIEATTKSIKSNTSEETDVESNINDKKKCESIKLKNKVNDLRQIQNMFKINEIGENNTRDTTIKSKPTENSSIKQLKKQEDKVVKIKIFNDTKDQTIEKENIYEFPHININENIIIEKPNSEVLVPIKNTNVSKNTAKETKELKIASESLAFNDSKNLNKHKINHEKIKNADKTLENNKSELIISYSQLANDTTPVIIIQLKRENYDSYKSLNTKHKLTTLESTIYKINYNKIKNKTIIPNNSSSAVIVTEIKENETSTIIDTSRVTEIKLDNINNSAQSDTSTLINPYIKPQVQKNVVEIVTNNNKKIVDSVAIIIHEETEENKKVAKKNNPKTNYWIQINDHEVYSINTYHDTIEPIDKDKVIDTEKPKISIKTDITINNNLKESNKKEIEESCKNDLIIENINQTKVIQYTESSTEHMKEQVDVEIFYKQQILKNNVQMNKTKQNFKKESESCLLIDTSNVPVKQHNIIGKSKDHTISIKNSNEYIKEPKVIKATTKTELIKNSDTLAFNKEKATNKVNNPKIKIETDKSIHNIIKEGEANSMIKTPTVSDEEKINIEKTAENQLTIEKPINNVEDSKEVDIKTKNETPLNTDYSTINIKEPFDKENNPVTEIQTKKSEDNIIKESRASSMIDPPIKSTDDKTIIEKPVEIPLPNDQATKSIKIEITTNTDSLALYLKEPIDNIIIQETETPTIKSSENMNIECGTCSPDNASTVSDDEKITTVETSKITLPNDQPTKSIKIETTPNTDSQALNVEESVDKELIPQTEKSMDHINIENETCSPANTLTVSYEEKITMVETTKKTLPNESPIKSVDELNVIDINTVIETTPNTDTPALNLEEPTDKNIIPETETPMIKSPESMNIECGTCSSEIASTVLDEEKITMVETTKKTLPNDQPTKSVEIETTPNIDSPPQNVEEPMDKGLFPQTDNSTDNINIESETCLQADTPTVSNEERTTKKTIPNESPIKSVDELNVIDINTEIETTPNTNTPALNLEEPTDKNIIQETETPMIKSSENMNIECGTCSPDNSSTVSDDEKITTVETSKITLPNDQPTKSIKIETPPNTDSQALNVKESVDKELIPQTEKSMDHIYIENETCSPANTLTVSYEEKITMVETTKKTLPNESPIKSVDELNVIDINTVIETTLNTDTKALNLEEPTDKNIIPETETPMIKSSDNMNIECGTCSPDNASTVSDDEKITTVETSKITLPNDQPTKTIKIETTPNTDSQALNVEETVDKELIPQTEKSMDHINIENETCSPANTLTVSYEEKITMVETTKKTLPNESPIKSVDELNVIDINTVIETTPNTDTPALNLEEPTDKNIIPETETPMIKSPESMNIECGTYSSEIASTVLDEEKITMVETTKKTLPKKPPIRSVNELLVIDINTEIGTTPTTDYSALNVEEPIDKELIPQTEKSTDNINIGNETCSPANTSTVSYEEKIAMVETTKKTLPNDQPTKSVEIETTPNTNTPALNLEKPTDKGLFPQTDNSTDKINIESETCLQADTPTVSNEEKTTKKTIPNESQIKSVDELNVIDINTEIETTPNTDTPALNLEEPTDKNIIPETETPMIKSSENMNIECGTCSPDNSSTVSDDEKITTVETSKITLPNDQPTKSIKIETPPNTDSQALNVEESVDKELIPQTEKSMDHIYIENETCSPANTLTVSYEEKITMVETTKKTLPNESPIKSVDELNVIDINTVIETTLNTDTKALNLEEPTDKNIIPETETPMIKSSDNMNIECGTCSPDNASTVSDDEKITTVETSKITLPNDQPTKTIKIETTPNTDSQALNVEETVDKELIPQTEKSMDHINIENETCSPANTLTVSYEEKITMVETTKKTLPNESPIKSVDELNVIDINTVIETTPNTDTPALNLEEPTDKNIIPETETPMIKSPESMNIECGTCSSEIASTVLDEEKITMVETTKKTLPKKPPIRSVNELLVIDINTEIGTTPTTDYSALNVEEPIDKELIPQTEKSTDNINIGNETCSPANTSTVSYEEKIAMVETTKKTLPNDQPTKSVEIETTPNTNTPALNLEEPTDKGLFPQTDNSTDKINIESETCLQADTPTVSNEEKTTKKTIPNESQIKSVDELNVIDINTEIETTPNTDTPALNLEEPTDKNIIPETETPMIKPPENMNIECETNSPYNASTVLDEEKITTVDTTKKTLPNDQPTKSVEIETTPNIDSPPQNVEEPIDKGLFPQTDNSTDNINIESETCLQADTPTVSNEEKTTKKTIPNESQIKSVDELNVIDINTEIETTPNTDTPALNLEEPTDKNIIPETETPMIKPPENMNIECETNSPNNASTVLVEEKITTVDTTKKTLSNDQATKSIKIETTPNTDSPVLYLEKPIDKIIILKTETPTIKSPENMNIECGTCSPEIASTASDEEKITTVETTEKTLPYKPPIKSVNESLVIDINTEKGTAPTTDSSALNIEESIDNIIIQETETQMIKSSDNMNIECGTCSADNASTVSYEEKIAMVETTKKTLLNEKPTKSVEIETTPNTNTPALNLEEPTDKNIIPETETPMIKPPENMNIECETNSPNNASTVLVEEKITTVETSKITLPNDQLTKFIKIETTPDTDSQAFNVEEPIDKNIIPETETQTIKSTDNMKIESKQCSPANASTVSDKEKITKVETTEKTLPKKPPITSENDLLVIDINTEIGTTPTTDYSALNVEEPIDKELIPQTEKSTDNINIGNETCSPANTSTVSYEEKIAMVETTKKTLPNDQPTKSVEIETTLNTNTPALNLEEPTDKGLFPQTDNSTDNINIESETCLQADTPTVSNEEMTTKKTIPNESPIKSVDELNVIDINTEIETTPNTDTPALNLEEPTDKNIIPETETPMIKPPENMNIECETNSPDNASTVLDEEKITMVETTKKTLPNDQPTKSVEIETTPNINSLTLNVEESIDKNIILQTETSMIKSPESMNIECGTCSSEIASTVLDEEKITMVETTKKTLPNDQPFKSVEIETTPNIDSPPQNVEEPMDKGLFPQTNNSTDNINIESETFLQADTPTVSNEEKTTKKTIPNESPIKSVDELNVIDINTEIETTPNTDTPALNLEEPTDKNIIPETETPMIKPPENMNIECETNSPDNASTVLDEEKITMVETTKKTLPNDQPTKSVEIETTPNINSLTLNVEESIDKNIILQTETPMIKPPENMNIECETNSPDNASTVLDEEKITTVDTTKKTLPNDQATKSIKIETTPNTDSPALYLEKPIDKIIILKTETPTIKSPENMNIECGTCSPEIASTASDEEKITTVETTEKTLPYKPPIKSVNESLVIDINTEKGTAPTSDSSALNIEEPIDNIIIHETETQMIKSSDNMNIECGTCSPDNASTVSDDEKITTVETSKITLPNDQATKSIKIETTYNTDSLALYLKEPIDNIIIQETETPMIKSSENMNIECGTCSPDNASTVSDDEKITTVETSKITLPNDQPTKSIKNVTTPNTDSQALNVEESVDNELIPQTEKSMDHINIENETCLPANTLTVSYEEKITMVETTKKTLPNESPIKSVDELNVIDINTVIETTPNTDTPALNLEEPTDKNIIPETETPMIKPPENMNIECETNSPDNASTVLDEEKITMVETTKKTLPNDQPTKSVEIETTPNINSPTLNVEESIDKNIILQTETSMIKSPESMNIECGTCSSDNASTISDYEKITTVETSKITLLNDQPTKSIKIETTPKTDYQALNVEETADEELIPQTEKSMDHINIENETCSTANTSTVLYEEKITMVETTKKTLPNDQPTKSVEIETTPNIDSPTLNVEESIDKNIISQTETSMIKSPENMNIECGTCSPANASTVSEEEKVTIVETTEKPLPNETPIESVEESKVVVINTETEPESNTDSLTINVEVLIDKESIRKFQIETNKFIDNSNNEGESCSPTDKLAASDKECNLPEKSIEILSPIEISITSSINAAEVSKVKRVNAEAVFVPNTDSSTVYTEEPLDEDYFSKKFIKTDKILDCIVKESETCPPIDTFMYVTEEMKGIGGTIEKLIPIDPSFVVLETENLTSIDGFNTVVNRQSGRKYLKDVESSTLIDTAAFVKDQKVKENETVIENILKINTSTASIQEQIQVEEIIKDESVILINDSVIFNKTSSEEQKKIETANSSSIAIMEEQTGINIGDVIYTCEESLNKTIVEKGIHSETTSTIDILATVVEEQTALEIEVPENATQVLNDTSTETIENLIETKKNNENETKTPIVVAKSEVERNEIKVMSENKTSTPIDLASTNTEQTETDMVTEITSPNVNILNSNTKIILIDKEMITENSNNPNHCYLKFGETSKIHSLENEDNLPGKSYGVQKLEMSVQRMKTSNEDYYKKTFLHLEQTENFSVENKDKVDCENKNIIDDKLYTVNESDLNAILCASSLEEALTLLDSKIKYKFKHKKLSNKANSTPHISKIQTSDSRSSETNTNFTDAREFFKEIEKKCKK